METIAINTNEVKKELYRSKVMAKFSHYTAGNVYYTVELTDGIYQFPMSTIERGSLPVIESLAQEKLAELQAINPDTDELKDKLKNEIEIVQTEMRKMLTLSSDLGTTTFCVEIKGSDLNRYIAKAIAKNDFIKIN